MKKLDGSENSKSEAVSLNFGTKKQNKEHTGKETKGPSELSMFLVMQFAKTFTPMPLGDDIKSMSN